MSYCICEDSGRHPQFHHNDIDLVIGVEVRDASDFHTIRHAVLETLMDFLPHTINKTNSTTLQLMENDYMGHTIHVSNQENRWCVVLLGSCKSISGDSCTIELKFVDKMKRKYEFSIDSFQILLDPYLEYIKAIPSLTSKVFYPLFVVESVYSSYNIALYHLNNRLIHTKAPEEIRGGGLLKYCSLLVDGFKLAANPKAIYSLEMYMCSRFFIDFPTEEVQYDSIATYVTFRFLQEQESTNGMLKAAEFLDTLKFKVRRRTKCLMKRDKYNAVRVISYVRNQLPPPAPPSPSSQLPSSTGHLQQQYSSHQTREPMQNSLHQLATEKPTSPAATSVSTRPARTLWKLASNN